MTTIDKSKPVMVTGATGYVAGWVVKKLLEQGITVHAAVRNPENKSKIAHLDQLAQELPGEIKYFKSDLLKEGSYEEAMKGCELVFHTASPFTSNYKDPQKELIDPAVLGTANVLKTASRTPSVKRVVITSSCAAIYTDCTDIKNTSNGILTEDVWNTTASLTNQPYSYSKTLAEKKAWELAAAQNQWDLVVVNPSMVLGPATNPNSNTSESFELLKQLVDGTMRMGVPKVGIGMVDVRDLAEAHINAGFLAEANGRNIINGHNSNFLEIATILNEEYGNKYKIPTKPLPKWLLMLIGPSVNKAITRSFVRNNVNKEFKADNSKSKKELGIKYTPLKKTLIDSVKVLEENKLI